MDTCYILKGTFDVFGQLSFTGYYTGKCVQRDGVLYAEVTPYLVGEAKWYSSRGRAQRAADRLNEKVSNYHFEVLSVEDEYNRRYKE